MMIYSKKSFFISFNSLSQKLSTYFTQLHDERNNETFGMVKLICKTNRQYLQGKDLFPQGFDLYNTNIAAEQS